MSILLGSNLISSVKIGATNVQAIYQGATKIWPFLATQKMNKSGNHSANTPLVTGWASDATYPSAIISDQLVVSGNIPNGFVKVPFSYQRGAAAGTSDTALGIYKNGTLIQTANMRVGISTTTGFIGAITPLANGDTIDLRRASSGLVQVNASGTSMAIMSYKSAPRMNKVGAFDPASGNYEKVTGWTSDSTDLATISGDGLVIPTTGIGNVIAIISTQGIGGSFGNSSFRLMLNGSTQIGTTTTRLSSNLDCSVGANDISFTAGDIVTLQFSAADSAATVTATSTYLQVFME